MRYKIHSCHFFFRSTSDCSDDEDVPQKKGPTKVNGERPQRRTSKDGAGMIKTKGELQVEVSVVLVPSLVLIHTISDCEIIQPLKDVIICSRHHN